MQKEKLGYDLNLISESEFEKMLTLAVNSKVIDEDRDLFFKESKMETSIRPAAVLLLFAFSENVEGKSDFSKGPYLLYVRRTETVATHKGQMAFPGGICEEIDSDNPVFTALRETEEEVGVQRDQVRIIGMLSPLSTVTGYRIQPVVGLLQRKMEDILFRLDSAEIAEAVWIPIQTLLSTETYRHEVIKYGEIHYPIHVYQVNQYRIWGATASMTKTLLDQLFDSKEA